jgi:hypothetical protein
VLNETRRRQWLLLSLAGLGIAVIWTVVLPRLARHPVVEARINHLQRNGVEPAALFYTDLEGMSEWEADVAAANARQPAAFWNAGQRSNNVDRDRPVSLDKHVHTRNQE